MPSFRWPMILSAVAVAVVSVCSLSGFQLPFREYPGFEYNRMPLPKDFAEKSEWTFGRLMYPAGFRGRRFRGLGDWHDGMSYWTMDYPRSDRHATQLVRRLTRIHARSAEQPINLEDGDDVYNWPWMYAVEVGHWDLGDQHVAKLRDYLLRGGFLMVDDFHGSFEWDAFTASMTRVFPDRPIIDIPDNDPIFHTIYDLNERVQVPGAQYLRSGEMHEYDGVTARWRGIYDDRGRIMVAICHNMDLGDSWEWADSPEYPEKFSALGIRIAINYIAYSMTH